MQETTKADVQLEQLSPVVDGSPSTQGGLVNSPVDSAPQEDALRKLVHSTLFVCLLFADDFFSIALRLSFGLLPRDALLLA